MLLGSDCENPNNGVPDFWSLKLKSVANPVLSPPVCMHGGLVCIAGVTTGKLGEGGTTFA